MTTILADIRDSRGEPLAGFIRVTLDDKLEGGNVLFTRLAAQVTLVNGLASFELEPSDLNRVTYLFEIFPTGSDIPVESFRARVPISAEPIYLSALQRDTGIVRETIDANYEAIIRRLQLDDNFWDRASSKLLRARGIYDPNAWYRRGDLVEFQGSGYQCLAEINIRNIAPTDTEAWRLVVRKGDTGSGTTGSLDSYNAIAWLGNPEAVGKGAIRNIVETLATKAEIAGFIDADGAILTNAAIGDTLTINDDSSRIAYTAWVQTLIREVRKALVPVGSQVAFTGTTVPTNWLFCDGRDYPQSQYPELFAVIGRTYTPTAVASNLFRVPDKRGRVSLGHSTMSAANGFGGSTLDAPANQLGQRAGVERPLITRANLPTGLFVLDTTIAGDRNIGSGTFTVAPLNNTGTQTGFSTLQPYETDKWIIYAGR